MPSSCRVAITAAGIVSPLGFGLGETVDGLREGRDCIQPVRLFDASRCRCHTAGQIDPERLLSECPLPGRAARRLHRASRMLIYAAREACEADPGFRPGSMVIGTTSGGMSFGESFFRALVSSTPGARHVSRDEASWIANYPPQKPIMDTLDALGLCVPIQIIANACASGSNAIGHAFRLIRCGLSHAVLAGGYDAISELVYVGFDSLQASTPEKCRPFDKNRSGLALGEGAAVVALEEMESALRRKAPILGEVIGYGISTDNYHLTQPNPSGIGPLLAMQRALKSADLEPNQIDYINAHGTATPFNDATEGAAIAQIFGPKTPVSSTKSLMGHALGAAGAIEAVFTLLALRNDFLPPNLNYREPDPQWELDLVANAPRFTRAKRALSNSFGFGGTNASLILERSSA